MTIVKRTAEFYGDSTIELLKLDVDDFIRMFNFYIDSMNEETKEIERKKAEKDKPKVISNAYDGFFDI